MKIGYSILAIFSFLIPFTFGYTTNIRSVNLKASATIIHYVKPVPTGTEDCSTWANACGLQTALVKANSGDEIWVMTGLYKPTGSDRTATFQLKSGVALYGGFPDQVNPIWEDREWTAYPTTLSGDIDGDGGPTGNAHRVVSADMIDDTVTLDGFIITGGNNDRDTWPAQWGGGLYSKDSLLVIRHVVFDGNLAAAGGGMFINGDDQVVLEEVEFHQNTATINGGGLHTYAGSNATLTEVTFAGNSADENGGGMIIYESGSPILSNVIFSGNSAYSGGGIYNSSSSSPTLTDVIFSGNSAPFGGGIYNSSSSSPTLTDVTFSGNTAGSDGGGMYNDGARPTLSNVIFSGNTAGSGGGMHNFESSPTLTDVTFSGNSADRGGGIFNSESYPKLANVTFSGNSAADRGGGMFNHDDSEPNLSNVTFSGNSAADRGGGMFNYNSSPNLSNVTFSGNSADSGGGMMNYDYSFPKLVNVTFSGNSAADRGGGMFNQHYSKPTLTNTILWGNTAGAWGAQIENDLSSTASISYSDVQGGCATIPGNVCTGGGNIKADPLFVRNPSPGADGKWGTPDDDYGNLRLKPNSPAIDAGNNAAVLPGVITDLDGNPRFVDIPEVPDSGDGTPPIVDMGAYEAQYFIINLPLVIK